MLDERAMEDRDDMKIGIKRVYEKPAKEHGYRILVDHL